MGQARVLQRAGLVSGQSGGLCCNRDLRHVAESALERTIKVEWIPVLWNATWELWRMKDNWLQGLLTAVTHRVHRGHAYLVAGLEYVVGAEGRYQGKLSPAVRGWWLGLPWSYWGWPLACACSYYQCQQEAPWKGLHSRKKGAFSLRLPGCLQRAQPGYDGALD